MVKKIEVKTSIGVFELIKPKAGVRNRAMMKAETDAGSMKRVVFITELLPKIINKRPEGCDSEVPIEHLLDSLEIEDYDLLASAMDSLVEENTSDEEIAKKKA